MKRVAQHHAFEGFFALVVAALLLPEGIRIWAL